MDFGLIGAGRIGALRAKALQRLAGAKLVAVADVDPERAAKAAVYSGARAFKNLSELLEVQALEAVIVSTPPPDHQSAVLAALTAGKHVLCEKPLSNSVASCRKMVQAAGDAGKILTTGFNHRYFPAIRFLKDSIDQGAIGRLGHVRAFAGHEGLSQFGAAWEYDKATIGGGALMDVGLHLIDLTAYLLGDVRDVAGVTTDEVWHLPGSEDNAFALFQNANGIVATLHASWTEWKGYRFYVEAYGDKGMVKAFYGPMMNILIKRETSRDKGRSRFRFYPMLTIKEKLFGWQSTVIETFREELSDFVDLCHGGAGGCIADGNAGLRAVEIANAVYQSSSEKRRITLANVSDSDARATA